MADRVFTAFAIEDEGLRNLLVGQARHDRTPFEWTDMSVKQPWDNNWKQHCRTRIRGCKAVIGIITSNTPAATGQLWELNCAYEELKPVMLIYGNSTRPILPAPLNTKMIHTWTWPNIANFLNRL